MKQQEFGVAASVTVHRVSEMSRTGRRKVCEWLRKLADDLQNEPDAFAKRFRARYHYAVKARIAVAVLGLAAGLAMAGDTELKPGGIEIGAASDGTPVFLLDVAAIDTKALARKRWYAKPAEVLRQVGSNTAENVTTHPGKWLTGGVAGYLIASGKGEKMLEGLFGGDDKPKAAADQGQPKPSTPTVNPYAETPPQYLVWGNDNQVTAPGAQGPVAIVGNGNQFDATPAPAQANP